MERHQTNRSRLLALIPVVAVGGVGLALLLRGDAPQDPEIRHVLLISIDTCRADHLGCYGCELDITPSIDAVAREAFLFENVISPAPLTLPAHTSMLTGTNPPYHGVHDNLDNRLAPGDVTLAEILQDRGFTTGAIISSFVLDSKFGLDQGFEVYNDRFEDGQLVRGLEERKGDEATRLAIEWFNQHRDQESFLFLHYYDPHTDYTPPEPFATRFAGRPYAGEIAFVDNCIGRVLDHLKSLDLFDSTLIIITADHGELLGEHGELTHSYFVYQGAIRVPLIFKLPGRNDGHRLASQVGLVDLVPTVCGLLGFEAPPGTHGRNLAGALNNTQKPEADRFIYCESLTPTKYRANSLLAAVGRRWKYIQTTRPELYDLAADPQELKNLATTEPGQVQVCRDWLEEVMRQQHRQDTVGDELQMDPEDLRRLESLGYVASSGITADFTFDQTREDPKDLLVFHMMDARVGTLIGEQRHTEARQLGERMRADRPDLPHAYRRLARIAQEQGDLTTAAEHLRRVLELDSEDASAHSILGVILTDRGQPAEALNCFRRAAELRPDSVEDRYNLASTLKSEGRLDEAIREFREVLRLDPDLARAHSKLGVALRSRGDLDAALKHLRAALEYEPDRVEAHQNLGIVYESQGQTDKALIRFRKAVELDPTHADAQHNIGSILATRGQLDAAIDHFRLALQANSGYHRAHYHLGLALAMKGLTADAVVHFQAAVRVRPDWLEPLNAAAWILATHPDEAVRDPDEALRLAQHAAELTSDNAAVLDTLGAACAATGRFQEAETAAQAALGLCTGPDHAALAAEIRHRLTLYREGRPYRDLVPAGRRPDQD